MRRIAVIAAVLAVGCAAAWLLLARPDAPERPGTATDSQPNPTSPAPGLAPSPIAKPPQGMAARPVMRHDGGATATLPTHSAPRSLRCDFEGVDAAAGGAVRVDVAALAEDGTALPMEVHASPPVAASLTLDVSYLFEGPKPPAELRVRADHRWYIPVEVRVSVPDSDQTSSTGPVPEYRALLPMRRAGATAGRVLDERGEPVAGATVSAHRLSRDGPEPAAAEVVQSAADGHFRLRAGMSGDVLVVAAADGLRPSSVSVNVAVGTDVPAGDIVLRRGVEVSGRVRIAGEGVAASVKASLDPPPERTLFVGRREVTWTEGRVDYRRVQVDADAAGRYRLAGLREGAYRVGVEDVRGTHLHGSATSGMERTVRAPASDVDFDVAGARLVLDLRGTSPPQGYATVTVFGSGGAMGVWTKAPGTLTMLVGAGGHYQVHVSAEGCEPEDREVVAPSVGEEREETIILRPRGRKGTLVVTLTSSTGVPSRAGFGLFPEGSDLPFPTIQKDVEANEGRYKLSDLDPGRYKLAVRAGGTWYGGQGYYLQAETPVEIPATGEAVVSVPVRLGGRLRIAARNEDGKLLSADCTIRDEHGKPVEVSYLIRSGGGWQVATGGLDDKAPSLVDPPLPAGNYEVTLDEEGYARRVVSARVEEGHTTDVSVVLARP